MKKFIYLIFAALTLASCVSIKSGDPYDGDISSGRGSGLS